ncbi:MAG: hypothetical protein KDK37_10025 [Leptospiraceae bacterium]|nr:hypothetical protein [Leptospiraceae bacterium]
MKGKFSLPAILGSLALVAVAFVYNQYHASNFTLPAEWEAAPGQSVEYTYVRRLPDRNGGYKVADCYVVQPFQNKTGSTADPGCIKKYKLDAICKQAHCIEQSE